MNTAPLPAPRKQSCAWHFHPSPSRALGRGQGQVPGDMPRLAGGAGLSGVCILAGSSRAFAAQAVTFPAGSSTCPGTRLAGAGPFSPEAAW